MKIGKAMMVVTAVAWLLSGISSQAQLDLSAGAIKGSLTGQELTGFSPMSNNGVNDGSISSWVVSDSAVDSSGLIFVYQVVNNGPDAIDEVELTGFSTSQILSSGVYSSVTGIAGLTPAATGAGFSLFNSTGNSATFQGGDLAKGNTVSDYLVIFTSDQAFGLNYGQDQDDFSAAGNILAPVPEANTIVAGALMLLPLGIGAIRAIRKDRIS